MTSALSSLELYRTISADQAHELLTAPIFEFCGDNPCVKVRASESGACISKGLKGVRAWFLKELKRNPRAKLFQSYATFHWAGWGKKTSIKEWNMDRRFWSVLDLDMPEVDGKKGVISESQIAAIQEYFPNSLILVGNGIQIFFIAGDRWVIDAYLLREMGRYVAAKVGLVYDNLHINFDGHPARRQTQAFRSPFSYADRANRPTICMIPALYEKFDSVEGAFKRFGLPTPAIPTAKELLEAPRRQGVGQKQPRKGNGSSLEKYGELSAICSARAKLMIKGATLEDAVIQVAGQSWSYWGSREIQNILLKPEFAPFVRAGMGGSGDWENREYDNDADGKLYYGGYKKSRLCLQMQRSRTLYACRAWALQFLYHTGDSAAEIIEHFHNWPILAEIRHHSIAAIKLSKQAVADLEEEHDGDEAAVKAAIRERQIEILNVDLLRVIHKFYDESSGTTKNVARLVHPETRQRVWEVAKALGKFTTAQISRELPRWENKQIRRALTQLMNAGKLNRTGSTKATTWELPQTPTSHNTPINLLSMSELPPSTTTTMKTHSNRLHKLLSSNRQLLIDTLEYPDMTEQFHDLLKMAGLLPPLPAENTDDMPPDPDDDGDMPPDVDDEDMPPDVDDEPETPADLPPDVDEEPVPATPTVKAEQIAMPTAGNVDPAPATDDPISAAKQEKLNRRSKKNSEKLAKLRALVGRKSRKSEKLQAVVLTELDRAFQLAGISPLYRDVFEDVYLDFLLACSFEVNWNDEKKANIARFSGFSLGECLAWIYDPAGRGNRGISRTLKALKTTHSTEYEDIFLAPAWATEDHLEALEIMADAKEIKITSVDHIRTMDILQLNLARYADEISAIISPAELSEIVVGGRMLDYGYLYVWKRVKELAQAKFEKLLNAAITKSAPLFAKSVKVVKLHIPPRQKFGSRYIHTAEVAGKAQKVVPTRATLAGIHEAFAGKG